jgi:hypothetical protein
MKAFCVIASVLYVVWTSGAAADAIPQGAPVAFAVSKSDPSIFYPTRALRKGDLFEVNVHHLHEYNRLIVVPCSPSCVKPDFVYAYPLSFGIQHLVIPISAHYYFWLERDQIGGPGIPYLFGWTRLPLPVLEQQAADNHFLAKFDRGTDLSLRTLYLHPTVDSEAAPYDTSARERILDRPVQY